MNRDTRDKFASGTDQTDLTTGNACWETSPFVFDQLNRDFGPFDVDICADAVRHLCPVWFGPDSPVGAYDALTARWFCHGSNGFDNPPYGPFIPKVLQRAVFMAENGFTSTHLLPLRVTRAFHQIILPHATELLFCDKRLVFFENGKPRYSVNKKTGQLNKNPDTALFDSIIVRFVAGYKGSLIVNPWHVPQRQW